MLLKTWFTIVFVCTVLQFNIIIQCTVTFLFKQGQAPDQHNSTPVTSGAASSGATSGAGN